MVISELDWNAEAFFDVIEGNGTVTTRDASLDSTVDDTLEGLTSQPQSDTYMRFIFNSLGQSRAFPIADLPTSLAELRIFLQDEAALGIDLGLCDFKTEGGESDDDPAILIEDDAELQDVFDASESANKDEVRIRVSLPRGSADRSFPHKVEDEEVGPNIKSQIEEDTVVQQSRQQSSEGLMGDTEEARSSDPPEAPKLHTKRSACGIMHDGETAIRTVQSSRNSTALPPRPKSRGLIVKSEADLVILGDEPMAATRTDSTSLSGSSHSRRDDVREVIILDEEDPVTRMPGGAVKRAAEGTYHERSSSKAIKLEQSGTATERTPTAVASKFQEYAIALKDFTTHTFEEETNASRLQELQGPLMRHTEAMIREYKDISSKDWRMKYHLRDLEGAFDALKGALGEQKP